MLQARHDTTNTLLTLVYDYLDALLASLDPQQPKVGTSGSRWKCWNSNRDCVHLQIGSLTIALRSIGLYPRKTADEVDMLPEQLCNELLKIRPSRCRNNEFEKSNKGISGGLSGKACGDIDHVQQKVRQALSETKSFAAKGMLAHVERQQTKARLDGTLSPGPFGNMILSVRIV